MVTCYTRNNLFTILIADYMDQFCEGRIALDKEPSKSISLRLTSAEEYDSNMNCYVTVTGDAGSNVLTSFKYVNIDKRWCTGDFVEIMEGDVRSHNDTTGEGKLFSLTPLSILIC